MNLIYSTALGLWEARDPALVHALLNDPRFGVRPPALPVPAALQRRVLGRQYARWLRMRDDGGHAEEKAALVERLRALPDAEGPSRQQASIALDGGWDHWIWASSVSSMAAVLGLPMSDLDAQRRLLAQCRALAAAISKGADLDAADAACAALLADLARDDDLALIWQSFEAGAALLGQAVIALSHDPAKRQPGSVARWLPDLFRQPGVILNTRRYARVALQVGGADLKPGDVLLLRLGGDGPSFGTGPHRCPGQALAMAMATSALEALLDAPRQWPKEWQILYLPNARIPIFDPEARP